MRIILEAANPDDVVEVAARYDVKATKVADAIGHGWPSYEYEGEPHALLAFLADQYEDGSGDPIAQRVEPCREGCGMLVEYGVSLSGPIEVDGVLHECDAGPADRQSL